MSFFSCGKYCASAVMENPNSMANSFDAEKLEFVSMILTESCLDNFDVDDLEVTVPLEDGFVHPKFLQMFIPTCDISKIVLFDTADQSIIQQNSSGMFPAFPDVIYKPIYRNGKKKKADLDVPTSPNPLKMGEFLVQGVNAEFTTTDDFRQGVVWCNKNFTFVYCASSKADKDITCVEFKLVSEVVSDEADPCRLCIKSPSSDIYLRVPQQADRDALVRKLSDLFSRMKKRRSAKKGTRGVAKSSSAEKLGRRKRSIGKNNIKAPGSISSRGSNIYDRSLTSQVDVEFVI